MHLSSIHAHSRGRADTHANLAASDGGHHNPDSLADQDLFPATPAQH
jgi:hypothetical protein